MYSVHFQGRFQMIAGLKDRFSESRFLGVYDIDGLGYACRLVLVDEFPLSHDLAVRSLTTY